MVAIWRHSVVWKCACNLPDWGRRKSFQTCSCRPSCVDSSQTAPPLHTVCPVQHNTTSWTCHTTLQQEPPQLISWNSTTTGLGNVSDCLLNEDWWSGLTAIRRDPSFFQASVVIVYRLGMSFTLPSSNIPLRGLQLNTRSLQTNSQSQLVLLSPTQLHFTGANTAE